VSSRELVPQAPARMTAWRRPGIVLLAYAWRAVVALLLAAPLAAAAGQTIGGYPRGDAELFDPGAAMLLEALRLARPAWAAVVGESTALLALVAVAGLLPMAVVIVAVGHEGRLHVGPLLGRAGDRLGTLALLLGIAMALEAVVIAVVVLAAESLIGRLHPIPPRADMMRAGGVALGVLVALIVGVVHDLARVAAVHRRLGLYRAASAALTTFRRAGGRALGAYALRGIVSLAVLAGAAFAVERFRSDSAGALAAGWMLHQIALLLAVACRVSWLAAALRLVETSLAPAEADDAIELDDADIEAADDEPVESARLGPLSR
jgi:hypothetical protein